MEIIGTIIVCFIIFVFSIKYFSIEILLWLKSSKPSKKTHYQFVKKLTSEYALFLDKRNDLTFLFKVAYESDFSNDTFYMYMPEKRALLGFGYLGGPIITDYHWRAVEFFG